MLKALSLVLLLLSFFPHVSFSDDGFRCGCDEEGFWGIERILEFQKVGDFLIAVAYFSIPIELLYFVSCSNIPFKWVLFEFIAFISFCGMTHLLNSWTYGPHSFQLMLSLTIFKALTALVSVATAITVVTLIPLLLKVKVREFMLKKKTRDLDQEVLIIKKQKEVGLHVRMLTQEIRKYLDRHTILYTTLVELSKTLDLKNCVIWMPNSAKTEMHLSHQSNERNLSRLPNRSIPTSDLNVREIKGSDGVKILDPESVLAVASSGGVGEAGSVAAIRMLMLMVSNFKGGTPEMVPACYAILVLVLPDGQSRSWSNQELEIVEAVADQVAVALSHASILEESQLMRDKLTEQNQTLQLAKQDALMASQARETFKTEISGGLRRPLHSILGLLSALHDEKLSDEQRLLVDSMVKTSNVLSTMVNDFLDAPGRDSGRFPLEVRYFQLHLMIREAACLCKCLSACRGYDFVIEVDKSLPNHVMGDERRVFQTILHMVGSLLSGSKDEGCVTLRVYSTSGSQGWKEQSWGQWRSNLSDGLAHVKFEVCICHSGARLEDTPPDEQRYSGGGVEASMSFNACKKLAQLMHGDVWVLSNPDGFDQGMALVLRFQVRQSSVAAGISEQHGETSDRAQSNSLLRGLKVVLADADDVNRAVTRKLLEKLGCAVSAVSSGYECLSAVGSAVSLCQVIITDLQLPDINGLEVTMRVRKFRSRSWPLIIGLSSSYNGDTWDKCMQIGMNGVIQKPVSSQELAYELKRTMLQANNTLLS